MLEQTMHFAVEPAMFDKTGELISVQMTTKGINGSNTVSLSDMTIEELEVLHSVISEYLTKHNH